MPTTPEVPELNADERRLAEFRKSFEYRTRYKGREERTDEFFVRLLDERTRERDEARAEVENLKASMEPAPQEDGWRSDMDAAKAFEDDDVLLGRVEDIFRIVGHWDDKNPQFPWQSPDGAAYPADAFNRWRHLPAAPPSDIENCRPK